MDWELYNPSIALAELGVSMRTDDFSAQFVHQTNDFFWLRFQDLTEVNVLISDFMCGRLPDRELALILFIAFRLLGRSNAGIVTFRDIEPGRITIIANEELRVSKIFQLAVAQNGQRINAVSDEIEFGKRNLTFRLTPIGESN